MLEQLNQSSPKKVKANVCIAGGGPAGIALALTLAELGLSSILLEGGLLERPGPEGRDPYKGEVTGIPYPLAASRLRYFGGTTNHWGGWCKPLDAMDYTRRPNAPLPSWPLAQQDLDAHLPPALRWCEIPNDNFNAETSVADPQQQLLFSDSKEFTDQCFRFSPPTMFGRRYKEDIQNSDLVRCIYDATLVSLKITGDSIRSVSAVSLGGDVLEVEADHFILAMGGIENARFLLHHAATNASDFAMGSDLLGCCFMDHFGFFPGYLAARSGLKHHRHKHDGAAVMPAITATAELQQEFDLPNICVMATPDAPSAQLPPGYFTNPGILGAGAGETSIYRLQLICEPTAHAASRIVLSDQKDAFGISRIKLDWQILEEDYLKVEQFMRLFELAVGREGLGRVKRTRRFENEVRYKLSGGMHHMGTTRMSDDPMFGVVDADCRVFGSKNLYIAGSSVFPRVGYTNPTLAILALADRLARHIHGSVS
jgi:choline dehydrogenase-like flavoprotein